MIGIGESLSEKVRKFQINHILYINRSLKLLVFGKRISQHMGNIPRSSAD
jgi:hypothetical protein